MHDDRPNDGSPMSIIVGALRRNRREPSAICAAPFLMALPLAFGRACWAGLAVALVVWLMIRA
jgi:hypothetical protein